MVFELSQLATGFEGCEKKLQIRFVGADLRKITLEQIVEILTAAKCTILQSKHNAFFDAYVLSESSLFVYPDQIILKTCGTTALLHCMPILLTAAARIGAQPHLVQFSRSNFMFPHLQPFPHRNFSTEVHYLNTMFDGSAYILGAINGPRWHVYFSDVIPREQLPESAFQPVKQLTTSEEKEGEHDTADDVADDDAADDAAAKEEKALINPTLEIVMFDLCPEAMQIYYQSEDIQTGAQCTVLAGIDQLIPGSEIDAFLFEPCGYSCNGLRDDVYFTIHITPEPECSFVSFETNLPASDYTDLVGKVLRCFRPGSFSVSLMVDDHSRILPHSREGMQWKVPGFRMHQLTSHSFAGGYNITAGQYASTRHHELQREQRLAFVQQEQKTQVVMTTPGSGGDEPETVLLEATGVTMATTEVRMKKVKKEKQHALVADVANLGADSAVGEMLLNNSSSSSSSGVAAPPAAAAVGGGEGTAEGDEQQQLQLQPVFGIEATAEFLKRMQEAIPTVAEALTPLASPTTAAVLQHLHHRNTAVQQQQQQQQQPDGIEGRDDAAAVDETALQEDGQGFSSVGMEEEENGGMRTEIFNSKSGSAGEEAEEEEEDGDEDDGEYSGGSSPIDSSTEEGRMMCGMRISTSSAASSGSSIGDGEKSPRELLEEEEEEEQFPFHHGILSGSGGSSGMSQSDEDYFSATDSHERIHHHHLHHSYHHHHLHHHHHHSHLLKKRGTSGYLPALTLQEARALSPGELEELACQVIRSSHYDACVLGETAQEDDSDKAPLQESLCVSEIRRELLNRIIQDDDASVSDGEAFFLVDIPELAQRYGQFLAALPRVEPFYNVRCNNDPGVLRVLNQLGCGFQCSSGTSLRMLGEEFGVETRNRIAFVNPWKPVKQIGIARDLGVPLLAFDHESELHKIKRHYPEAELLLQIDPFSGDLPGLISAAKRALLPRIHSADLPSSAAAAAGTGTGAGGMSSSSLQQQLEGFASDDASNHSSSSSDSGNSSSSSTAGGGSGRGRGSGVRRKKEKRSRSLRRAARQQHRGPSATHGASIDSVESLLQTVSDLGLNLVGVSVKLSTKKRCCEPRHMCRGLRAAKAVFDLGKARFGMDLRVLDIGDTFPNPSAFCNRPRRGISSSSSSTSASIISSSSSSHSNNNNSCKHLQQQKDGTPAAAAGAGGGVGFQEMARQVNQTLEQLFPSRLYPGLRILADPARYIVTTTHTLAVSVIGKREVNLLLPHPSSSSNSSSLGTNPGMVGVEEEEELEEDYPPSGLSSGDESGSGGGVYPGVYSDSGDDSCPAPPQHSNHDDGGKVGKTFGCQYYINDGLYGSFNSLLYDRNHARVAAKSVRRLPPEAPLLRSTLFGPTCDGLDCVMEECELPELQVGDWLYFEDMGAHTLASGTNFNGFVMPQSRYLVVDPVAGLLD